MGFQQFAHCLEHLELKCAILMSVFEQNCLFCCFAIIGGIKSIAICIYFWTNWNEEKFLLFGIDNKRFDCEIQTAILFKNRIFMSNVRKYLFSHTLFVHESIYLHNYEEKKFNESLFILENRIQKISSIWRLFGWIFLHELRRRNAWKETKKKILIWKWMIWR